MNNNAKYKSANTSIAFERVSENAIMLTWQTKISLTQHLVILELQAYIRASYAAVIIDTVASYHCLMIYFDFEKISSTELIKQVFLDTENNLDKRNTVDTRPELANNPCIKIPVYYDTDNRWDLAEVASQCQLSAQEVINKHSNTIYHSFALGFTPGFCYLASLPKALQLPRKSTPRIQVPTGAVAIAEIQTAVYPSSSPGGWHIIGQTPIAMYTASQEQFIPTIGVGQSVQFYPITKSDFIALEKTSASNSAIAPVLPIDNEIT